MVNWIFWVGIVVGWYAAAHFVRPIISKILVQDTNTILVNNPQLKPQIEMQLSPQDIMIARQQGIMV